MSKERLRAAKNLIKQGRYDHACDILRELDDPTAQAWLEKLETMKPRRRRNQNSFHISDYRPLFPYIGLVLAIAMITGLMYGVTNLINEEANAVNDTKERIMRLEGWDEVYYAMVNYCLPRVSYGADTCPDWVDSILGNPFEPNEEAFNTVKNCVSLFGLDSVEADLILTNCLNDAGIPPPPGY